MQRCSTAMEKLGISSSRPICVEEASLVSTKPSWYTEGEAQVVSFSLTGAKSLDPGSRAPAWALAKITLLSLTHPAMSKSSGHRCCRTRLRQILLMLTLVNLVATSWVIETSSGRRRLRPIEERASH